MYLWDSYLPVLSNPYDERGQRMPACHILSGTPITLSNGTTQVVEKIAPGVQVLSQLHPIQSTPVVQYPIPKPLKAKLIGLSECILPKLGSWKHPPDLNKSRWRGSLFPDLAGFPYNNGVESSGSRRCAEI